MQTHSAAILLRHISWAKHAGKPTVPHVVAFCLQAVNKAGGSSFLPADEANLQLFSVHLGNTLTKSRLYASIM